MISVFDLEERVYEWLDDIYSSNKTTFGFPTASSGSFLVDRQNMPRIAASTILYYRVEEVNSFGSVGYSDTPVISRNTTRESIEIWRRVHIVVNVLSKVKGKAKDAVLFLSSACQSTRGRTAGYTGDFDLALYQIGPDFRDLTDLENEYWTERVETDLYFNYTDTVSLDTQYFITAPSSEFDIKEVTDFDIDLK